MSDKVRISEQTMRMRMQPALAALVAWASVCVSAQAAECDPASSPGSDKPAMETALVERGGPRIRTSGRVPHVQVGVAPIDGLTLELTSAALSLPGVEKRPTVVSQAGATGLWLADDIPVVHPLAIVSGREFAHIHPDGSLHAPFSLDRAIEIEKRGWGERHPWADRFDGWDGLVMLFSPSTDDELQTLLQLVTESYNHVTGLSVRTPGRA